VMDGFMAYRIGADEMRANARSAAAAPRQE